MSTIVRSSSEFKQHHKKPRKKSKKLLPKLWRFTKRYGIILTAIFIISIIAMFAWFSRGLPNPDKIIDRNIAQSTKIYDSKGETVLYDIHGAEKRTLVVLDDLPDYVHQATIATEDRHFYEHNGFNLVAMFKGVIINPLMGKRVRGGSTLTQQLVKNAILTNERSVSRKIREFILSYRIEKKFEKNEILQMYLNEIPYGSTAYGVESAAHTYFGKPAKDLTLAEAALLASLPKAPTYYSPYGSNVDKLLSRKDFVLQGMVETGYVTQEEADEAKDQELVFKTKSESILAPHFVMYVREQLAELFGEKMVEQGGLRVITTLDLEKQVMAEEAVVNGVDDRSDQYGFSNAALVALDVETGQIISMVGSKDYFDDDIDGKVNVTTRLRQPGSSIKPMVYAAAFEKGYTPDTILYDVKTVFKTDTENYEPNNYDLVEHGPVTMRKSLQGSLNITAVKALYLVGVDRQVNFLEMLGYSSFEERSRFGLSLVLGGGEVKLLEHVAAFNVFPSEGVYKKPESILLVEDSKGNILYEFKERNRKVLDKNIANMTNNVLSDNDARAYVFGLNSHLALNRPSGAKTGTTNDYRDAWTVGYTPQIVAGVWVGNNDNESMLRGAAGGVVAAPIWNEFMRKAHEGLEVKGFNSFTPHETDKPILNGSFASEVTMEVDKFSGKVATENTPDSAKEEKTFKEIHSILHYINKEDPQGMRPEDPTVDWQYVNWEAAVSSWVERQKSSTDPEVVEKFTFINEAPPTEMDDVHLPEYQPTLFLKTPGNNETINSQYISSSVSVSAPRGVSRVEYFIDDKLVRSESVPPYNLHEPISSLFVNGYHKFKVIAYDDVDNQSQLEIDINILAERKEPEVSWIYPGSGTSLKSSAFPLNTSVQITDVLATKKVDFFYRLQGDSDYTMYASEIAPRNSRLSVVLPVLERNAPLELKVDIHLRTGGTKTSYVSGISM